MGGLVGGWVGGWVGGACGERTHWLRSGAASSASRSTLSPQLLVALALLPLSNQLQVDSVDASAFTPADGSGHVRVLATVDESADLFASNGKQGDSYTTTYQARGQG